MTQTAAKVLVLAGLGNLLFALLFGIMSSRAAAADPEAEPFGGVSLHLAPTIEGLVLLGCAVAVAISRLRGKIELGAAALLVAGSILQAVATISAWRSGAGGPYSGSAASQIATAGAAVTLVGLAILAVGVIKTF